jgi:L-lysine exporter family protein LysE/ArgO
MLFALLNGFLLGISLIAAIGAQNAFVINQGLTGKHIFNVALFCAFSDALLICIGVTGASKILNVFIANYSNMIYGFTSIWLFAYGLMKFKSSLKTNRTIEIVNLESKSLKSTISVLAILTFANPHVYLDTMILIGTFSQKFIGFNKLYFTIGAILASFVFFFFLAYGAKTISPLMKSPKSWQILDFIVALIMFSIAFNFASSVTWK